MLAYSAVSVLVKLWKHQDVVPLATTVMVVICQDPKRYSTQKENEGTGKERVIIWLRYHWSRESSWHMIHGHRHVIWHPDKAMNGWWTGAD